jgi:opacity protein-like surface antigen
MKKIGVLAVALVTAFLLVGAANAEMYVEGYLGGTAAANMGQALTIKDIPGAGINGVTQDNHLQFPGTSDATVLGGLKLGTWFVKEGFAGYSGYPDWMKYFGFYTDFSYQKLELRSQSISGTTNITVPGAFSFAYPNAGAFTSEGSIVTWAFMFAGRYGFFPDSEVPFGRLQPYVAVGPAIMFSSMSPKVNTLLVGPPINGFQDSNISGGSQASTNIALAVDAGIRIMALKNVSFDISFKYRYAQPSYTFSGIDDAVLQLNAPATFKLNPVYSLFSGQLGVAYHF